MMQRKVEHCREAKKKSSRRNSVQGSDGAIRDAVELSVSARLSFWDALVVVAAARLGAKRLYSEDLQDGQTILGLEVVNPFGGGKRSR
jgi:predicted nucleic acid-binding protein